jgi:hypothetical protein
MPIQPLSNETSRQITEGEQIPAPDAPFADHNNELTPSQENLNQFREENPDVQGQQGQKSPEELQRNPDAFKNITRFAQGG